MNRLACQFALTFWMAGFPALTAQAGEQKLACPMGREYYLYTPDSIDANQTYWLVVGVHGYKGNGRGAGGYADWAKKGNCIVIGPTFPSEGYQVLQQNADKQLIGLAESLAKKFKLHPKMFLVGFSGGSQFVHRFTMKHPDLVIGCAAHSGGTWADTLNPGALGVPFAISCGEKDTNKSTPDCPLTRVEWARAFAAKMQAGGFYFKFRTWPDVGHAACAPCRQLTEECFVFSTTGMHEDERKEAQKELDAIATLIKTGELEKAMPRISGLGKFKAEKVEPQAKEKARPDKENKFGWVEGQAARASLEKVRQAYLQECGRELEAQAARACMDKIADIEKRRPANAAEQLAKLLEAFAGRKQIAAEIARVQNALKKA